MRALYARVPEARTKEAGHTGVMLAFFVPPAALPAVTALQEGLPNPEPREDLHLTLAYLGDSAELADQRAPLEQLLASIAWEDNGLPMSGTVGGIGRFHHDEGNGTNAVYASFDSPDLPGFRQFLVDALTGAGIPYAQNHGFTPHITLAYVPLDADIPTLPPDELSDVTFGVLTLAWGDERISYGPATMAAKAANIWTQMEQAGAVLSEIIGIYSHPTKPIYVNVGDWATEDTMQAIRRVVGPDATVEAEASPGDDYTAIPKPGARTKAANYSAHAGETIAGNLARGGDGKFASAGNASAAPAKQPAKEPAKQSATQPSKQPGKRRQARAARRAKKPKVDPAKREADRKQQQAAHDAERKQRQAQQDAERHARQQQMDQERRQHQAQMDAERIQRQAQQDQEREARQARQDAAREQRRAMLEARRAARRKPAKRPAKQSAKQPITQPVKQPAKQPAAPARVAVQPVRRTFGSGDVRGSLTAMARGQGAATQKALTVLKDARGRYRWLTFSSTAFRDRDREIVSTKALADDVVRADRDRDYGPLRWWHLPGLDIGDCDFNAMHGRTLIESGTFRDERYGVLVAAKATDLGVSIGFHHPVSEPDGDRTFHRIRRFERSLVPLPYPSNLYTALVVKENTMDSQKIEGLKALGFDDEMIAGIQEQASAREKSAEAAGVAFKADAPPADAPADATPADMPADTTDYVGDMSVDDYRAAFVQPIIDAIGALAGASATKSVQDEATATALKSTQEQLAATNQTIAQLQAQLTAAQANALATTKAIAELQGDVPAAVKRASQDPGNVATKEQADAFKGPAADPMNDFLGFITGAAG